MEIKEFKIRASGCGQIMTGSIGLTEKQSITLKDLQSKDAITLKQRKTQDELEYKKANPTLPETLKSFCQTWLKEQLYNRRNEFSSKYTQKGNEVEDNSLDYIAEQLDLGMLLKNEEYFESNFLTGTPDAILKDYLIDVKNSWDCFTFPLFEKDIPNKDYFYQAQCYMHLTNRKSYKLIYVLSDTPNHLIEKDAYWWCKNNGYDELDGDIFEQFVDKYTYKNINDKLKIKVFNIEYDESVIEAIYDRVAMCREYIEQLLLIIK